MCGVAGFVDGARLDPAERHRIAAEMALALAHRGPDDSGVWTDADGGVVLAHRRLSIVDLSAAGHQPMTSPSGRFVITYNGEIYNFRSLREDLAGGDLRFQGTSDTEVLLAAVDRWGVETALERINGMFAFALWDRQTRSLHLVRDRLGKKPLYFGRAGRSFLFASELKAFHAHPDFVPQLDRAAVALFLQYGYVPTPHSIYKGVFKLPAAGHLALPSEPSGGFDAPLDHVRTYWSLRERAQSGMEQPLQLSEEEASERLEEILSEAVAQRMIADVPLGAFLSGGIDSSTVVALMQKCASRPVKTFTIGFHERDYNEAEAAKEVARHLGTEHHELYVTPGDAQSVIPNLATIYDEPFADISQIPTYLVSRFTRDHVKVALSGDGGDEAFGGYTRHFVGPRLWKAMALCPTAVRRVGARLLTSVAPAGWDKAFETINRCLPQSQHRPTPGYHVHKLAGLLAVAGPEDLYDRLVSRWTSPASMVIGGVPPRPAVDDPAQRFTQGDLAHRMMYYDTMGYLPDDILVKVDRATMAVGLEARAPLLDYRVMEFSWQLPLGMKVQGGQGKRILRQILARHVPTKLVDRPKQGFVIPVDQWLRGPLRDWAEAMLDPQRLRAEGVLEPKAIRQAWNEHLSGKRTRIDGLWCILMFQAWHERWASAR